MTKRILVFLALSFSSIGFATTGNYSCDVYKYVKNGTTQKDVVTAAFPTANNINVYTLPNTQSQLVFFKSEQVGLFINKDLASYFQVPAPGVFPTSFNIASSENTTAGFYLVRANCTLGN